jgi:hypothetical protein
MDNSEQPTQAEKAFEQLRQRQIEAGLIKPGDPVLISHGDHTTDTHG